MKSILLKKIFLISIVFVFIIINNNIIIGQNINRVFKEFSKEQGLSNNYINAILQDKQGFLWIASWNGLYRYDGYKFINYKPIENGPLNIFRGVKWFTKDNNDRIWMVSPVGLNFFNIKNESFNSVYFNDSLTGNYFTCLLLDSKGKLWLGTHSEGIWTLSVNDSNNFSKTKLRFGIYKHFKNNPNSISANIIHGIYEDKQSNIWIIANNKIIDRYIPQTGNFEHYPIDIPNIEKQATNVSMQFQDSDSLYWITSSGAGLISWNRKLNVFRQFLNKPGENSLSANIVNHVRQADDGVLWISTDGGGISLYNKKTGLFDYCRYEPLNPKSLSSDAISLTFEDKSGVTWVGTTNAGLNMYEEGKTNFGLYKPNPFNKTSLNNKSVTSIIEDENGNFWIGTDGGGLNFWDKKTNKFTYFINNPNDPNSISGNAVVCLTEDFHGDIWIGTFAKGLNCYLRKEGKFIHFANNPDNKFSISSNNIWALLEDNKHNIWIGTLEGTLNLLDYRTKQFYYYKNEPGDTNSFVERYTTNLFEDSRHYLWITTSNGLEMVKLDNYNFDMPLPKLKFNHYRHKNNSNSLTKSNVYCIFEDHEGNMWFGTDGAGLNKLNLKTNEFTAFSEKDGLSDRSIKAIQEDNDYNLWISTGNGLTKLNPKTKSYHNYDFTDGLQDYSFSNAHCKTKDSKLLFGGVNGFNIFDPNNLRTNNIPPKVVIIDFKVYNNSVAVGQKFGGKVLLKKSITETEKLTLSHEVNLISFEFSALDFTNPEKNGYAYKMEGFDNQWRNTDAKNRTATYTNLEPGEYTFRVKASNNDDIWNEEGTSIRITILPPWWKTWWARFVLIIIITGLIYLAFYLRLAFYRKQQKELTIMVKDRTHELEESNVVLEEKQEEINLQKEELMTQKDALEQSNHILTEQQKKIIEQNNELDKHRYELELLIEERTGELETAKQKAEESDKLKSAFLSNMSHEIRTPMNAIIGFSTLLRDQGLSEKEKEDMISIIINNGEYLLDLINDILDLSKIQANQMVLNPLYLNLTDFMRELQENFIIEAESKKLSFILSLENIPDNFIIDADRMRLKQVLSNLLTNSIKFTQSGGIEFGVKSIEGKVTFFVSDTGIGIPFETGNAIFERFLKIENRNHLFGGTGLGLAICKSLVDIWGGKIWYESEVNKRTTFYFTYPLLTQKKLKQNKPQQIILNIPDLSGKIILVAEDEENNFKLLEVYLLKTKAKIIWVKNGTEAIEYVKSNNVDIILMDIKMPMTDGIEATRQIKSIKPSVPIIAQTAYAFEDEKKEFLNSGINAYLVKPIKINDLMIILKNYT